MGLKFRCTTHLVQAFLLALSLTTIVVCKLAEQIKVVTLMTTLGLLVALMQKQVLSRIAQQTKTTLSSPKVPILS